MWVVLTLAYCVGAVMLLGFAFKRKPDFCVGALAVAFVVSVIVFGVGVWSIMPFAATIDALICIVMLTLWTHYKSHRARAVGAIGLVKTAIHALQYVNDPYTYGVEYTLVVNACFLMQVLAAGGYLDAVGRWLGDLPSRVVAERLGLHHDGER